MTDDERRAAELPLFDRSAYERLIRHNAATYERHSVTILEELPAVDPDVVVVRYDSDSRWAAASTTSHPASSPPTTSRCTARNARARLIA
jgi:hypothetical protein